MDSTIHNNITNKMLSKSPLSSHLVDIFDAKAGGHNSNSKEPPNTYRVWNTQLFSKYFERDSKSHIIHLQAPNKLTFPKDEKYDLSITLPYLIIQCYLEGNQALLELDLKDANKTKRRVIFTNTVSKIERKPFFVKVPSQQFRREIYMNLCIDLASFMKPFQKAPDFGCLEGITIGGNIKIRKIFAIKSPLEEGEGIDQSIDHLQENLPRNYCFPSGTKYVTSVINYERFEDLEESRRFHNVSLPKISNHRDRSTPKAVVGDPPRNQSSEQKKFMSNTITTQLMNRLRDKNTVEYVDKNNTTVKGKRGGVPPLPTRRPSIKAWKYSKNESEDERITKSEKITQLKKKNYAQKNVDQIKRGEQSNYSDSDYLEMSQKFSTVTNPKLFRNWNSKEKEPQKEEEPQIEEFIEIEESTVEEIKAEQPLNHMATVPQETENNEESIIQSREGFLQQHLKKCMQEIERPYTPPLIHSASEQSQTGSKIEEGASERGKCKEECSKVKCKDRCKCRGECEGEKQLELMYDPILNCYFDFKTNTYYELKQ